MTITFLIQILRDSLYLIIIVSLPILIVSLGVGILTGIFQTITQIQEQTLTFVPKMLAVFLTLALLGGWMGAHIYNFTTKLWNSLSLINF